MAEDMLYISFMLFYPYTVDATDIFKVKKLQL